MATGRLGVDCVACSANLTALLLVVAVMNLAAIAFMTAAITLERLAPAGVKVARAIGALVVGVSECRAGPDRRCLN